MENDLYSKNLIYSSLIKLMKNKKYEHISITEIAKKAGINRVTFYKNFETKEDVLAYGIKTRFEESLNEIEKLGNDVSFKRIIKFQLEKWTNNKEEIKTLFNNNCEGLIFKTFFDNLFNTISKYSFFKDMSEVQRAFITTGTYGFMMYWITYDNDISMDYAIEAIYRYVCEKRF